MMPVTEAIHFFVNYLRIVPWREIIKVIVVYSTGFGSKICLRAWKGKWAPDPRERRKLSLSNKQQHHTEKIR